MWDTTYTFRDGKSIPAANVNLRQATEGRLAEWWSSPESRVSFYIGDVTADYEYVPPSRTIRKGQTAYLLSEQPDGSSYRVQDKCDNNFEGTVKAKSVVIRQVGERVPNHEIEPIKLMCFELLPYAAVREGLITEEVFFTGLRFRPEDGSTSWVELLGESLASKPDLTVADLKTTRFSPGDIIVLYDEHGRGIHMTIASDQSDSQGEPLVYSLSHSPTENPGLWPIMEVVETFARTSQPVVKAKTVTPRSPSTT